MIAINKWHLITLSKAFKIRLKDIYSILENLTSRSSASLFFDINVTIPKECFGILISGILRLHKQEPLAKILQKKEFYSINFKTSEHTLDPRPETELLIDITLGLFEDKSTPIRILDLGCGTGCIGLTLLTLFKSATTTFVDISPNALDVTITNAHNLNLFDRSEFIISNWFTNVKGSFDLIVSNPPYIKDSYPLDDSTMFDPDLALFGGADGLNHYKTILADAPMFLVDGGHLLIEIGIGQEHFIKSFASQFTHIQTFKDLNGISRSMLFKFDHHS